MWWMWIACTSAPDAANCQQFCADAEPATAPAPIEAPAPGPASSGVTLTAFEKQLLDPLLEDIRAGVRPFGPDGVGICEGDGPDCTNNYGLTATDLPAGKHHLRAELAVPKTGEKGTWTMDFHLECIRTSTLKDGSTRSTTTNQDRQYTVIYAGTERGYRLTPLWKIESPGRSGSEDCRYKLTMPHPDGDKVITGSWTVPAPPA